MDELLDKLEMIRFFNQRAGRELWADKPKHVQEQDITTEDNILAEAIELVKRNIPADPAPRKVDAGFPCVELTCPSCGTNLANHGHGWVCVNPECRQAINQHALWISKGE